ncbi:MAG: hypothetical protein VKN56_03580, partial [Cyanobacteriota bacterium]|nr:hypothetical protein [Cyanobacteriota bacterium]
ERTMGLEPLTGSDGRPVGAGRVRILQRRCVLCGYGQKAQELVPPRRRSAWAGGASMVLMAQPVEEAATGEA